MHPTLAVGLAALTWLLVHNSSSLARVLLAVAAFMLGWEPASAGSWLGFVLVSVAVGAAASVVWEEVDSSNHAPQQTDDPPVAAPERPARAERSGARTQATSREPNDPLTELEQAELFSDLLDVNIAGLEEAKRNGDLRAQAAFAGEIEDLANEMRSMLRVVLGERHRIAKPAN